MTLAWNPSLKPANKWLNFNPVLPVETPNNANSALDESRKERQPYITPDRSAPTGPPPSVPSKQDIGIKTPCPDFTTGLRDRVVAAKLESIGVSTAYSDHFLRILESRNIFISCPTQSAMLLRLPSLVVEGKSYGTGKTLYEAQNQAAVSGSMMLVIQHQLSELAGKGFADAPLAFSICTEGPVIELWVHYNIFKAGVRYYKMQFLLVGHASALNTMEEFFLAVLRIMRWTNSTFLDDAAEKLLSVWKRYYNNTA